MVMKNKCDGRLGLLDVMDEYNDEIVYNNKDIENYILKKKPKLVIVYQNIDDIHHYNEHFLHFKDFILNSSLQNIFNLKPFKYEIDTNLNGTQHHSIRFPDNKSHINILQEFFGGIKYTLCN